MQTIPFDKPVIGFSAYSGSGKTTLLEKLIPILSARKLRVAVIKHAHHSFDIDHPEKDSYKIRKAGAQQILISSQKRWAMIHEHADERLRTLSFRSTADIFRWKILILSLLKGSNLHQIAKIEIHRPALGKPLISATDKYVIAVATDEPNKVKSNLPLLDLNDTEMIADYIEQFLINSKV